MCLVYEKKIKMLSNLGILWLWRVLALPWGYIYWLKHGSISSKNVQFVEHEVFMTARDGKKPTMKWRSKEQQRWNIPEDNLGSGSKISCGIFSFLHNWWRVTFILRNKIKIIPVHVFTSSVSWSFFKLHQPPSLL